jgi:hypothetical protein
MMSPGALVGVQAQAHGPRLIFIFLIFLKGPYLKKKQQATRRLPSQTTCHL